VTHGSPLGYNLFVDGILFGNNPRSYENSMGQNELVLAYPADSTTHIVTVQDLNNPICAASDFFHHNKLQANCQISGFDYTMGNGRKV
jgi:hypothetical protein